VCGEPTEKAKEFIEQAASCHLSSKLLKQRGILRGRQFLKSLFGMEAVVWMLKIGSEHKIPMFAMEKFGGPSAGALVVAMC